VQLEIQSPRASQGSFRKSQQVLALGLLPEIYQSLPQELDSSAIGNPVYWPPRLTLVDSSLWEAAGRMQ